MVMIMGGGDDDNTNNGNARHAKLSSQILSGTYPIAQVREPYSVVGYLAVCTPLEKVLNLVHPKITEAQENDEDIPEGLEWSAWDICDGNYCQ